MKNEIISVNPEIFSTYFSALLDMSKKLISGSPSGDDLIKNIKIAINDFGQRNAEFSEFVFEGGSENKFINVEIGSIEAMGFSFVGMTILEEAKLQKHILAGKFNDIFTLFCNEISRGFQIILDELGNNKNKFGYSDINLN